MSGVELDFERPADDTQEDGDDVDREAVLDHIESRAAAIRERQLDRTLSQCAANGDLTPGQERAVETMAENIVESLLDAPRTTVEDASDPEKLRTALDLFDPDQ